MRSFWLLVCLLSLMGTVQAEEEIQWFGSWKEGAAVARATNRPILLVSAAPHCRNISGIW